MYNSHNLNMESKNARENRSTLVMNIPKLKENEIFFINTMEPGVVFAGTLDHFQLSDHRGLEPCEMTWEQAILMLNSRGWFDKKYKFQRCLPLNSKQRLELDDSIPIVWDVSDWVEEID